MALAALQTNQRWLISELEAAVQPIGFFGYLQSHLIQPGCILAGFDFPIGIPSAYAGNAGITDFLSALSNFGHGPWREFYMPAEQPSQISLYRPFYPSRPGNSKRRHLEDQMDIPFQSLYRLCEIGHDNRRPACPLFWTLGSQQVGKAAITGWETLLTPALTTPELNLKIWPFSGPLDDLLIPGVIVVVETYPAEFYGHIGLNLSTPIRWSKRRQVDRQTFSDLLINWANDHQLDLTSMTKVKIADGFGHRPEGEDQFDALVGLYGMINVIQGNHTHGEPGSMVISKIEGWIFGQEGPK